MENEKSNNNSFERSSNLHEADTRMPHLTVDDENSLNTAMSKNANSKAGEAKNINGYYSIASEEEHKTLTVKSDTNGSNTGESTPGRNPDRDTNDEVLKNENESCDILGNGQLIKTVLEKSNTIKRPVRGELVTIDFSGKLIDDRVVEKQTNFQIHVGDFEVSQGLDMTIPFMNIYEVAEVSVDPRLAYGSLGLELEDQPDKSIPPDSKIIYTVKLLDIKNEDDADLKSLDTIRKLGAQKKERGNFWYNRSEYNTAIQLYRRALEYLDKGGDLQASNSDLQILLNDRIILYNNLAMAQIKINDFDAALKSVEHVLHCQPNNAKALYRKGRILESKGDIKGAISLLQKAAALEPDSKGIQSDLSKLFIRQRRDEHNEKELYQKMLGQAKKMEQKSKELQRQQESQGGSKLKLVGYLLGTILAGVAGVAIYRYNM